MKRLALAYALSAVALAVLGCSDSTSTDGISDSAGAPPTSLTPDEVLEEFVTAVKPLNSVGETDGDPATEFRQVSDTLGPLAGSLTEGIEGVPEDVSYEAAVAAGSLAVSIDLVVECLSTSPTECESFVSNSVTLAQEAGQAISEIVPYSNWTVEELIARLR